MWSVTRKEGGQCHLGVIRGIGLADEFLQPIHKDVRSPCCPGPHPRAFILADKGDIWEITYWSIWGISSWKLLSSPRALLVLSSSSWRAPKPLQLWRWGVSWGLGCPMPVPATQAAASWATLVSLVLTHKGNLSPPASAFTATQIDGDFCTFMIRPEMFKCSRRGSCGKLLKD